LNRILQAPKKELEELKTQQEYNYGFTNLPTRN
jgi:hypothetical protein